jgi:hypothetical protein
LSRLERRERKGQETESATQLHRRHVLQVIQTRGRRITRDAWNCLRPLLVSFNGAAVAPATRSNPSVRPSFRSRRGTQDLALPPRDPHDQGPSRESPTIWTVSIPASGPSLCSAPFLTRLGLASSGTRRNSNPDILVRLELLLKEVLLVCTTFPSYFASLSAVADSHRRDCG